MVKGLWDIKKILFPLIYIGEWILFLFVLLLSVLFNLTNIFNLIYADMPYEEPISLTSTSNDLLFIVLGLGLIMFFYIKFLTGNQVYRFVKEIIWGSLIGLNFSSCMLWLLIGGGFNYSTNDWILYLAIMLISAVLMFQITIKLWSERKMIC